MAALNTSYALRVRRTAAERTLGDWQSLVLYPANSIFVNGYLTTPGQAAAEARTMCETLGFALENEIETVAG